MQSLISFSLTCEASVELNKPSFATLASFQPGGGRYSIINCTQGNPVLRFASATHSSCCEIWSCPCSSQNLQLRLLKDKIVISSVRGWWVRSASEIWWQVAKGKVTWSQTDYQLCVLWIEVPWDTSILGNFSSRLFPRQTSRSFNVQIWNLLRSTCSTSYCGAEYFCCFFPSANQEDAEEEKEEKLSKSDSQSSQCSEAPIGQSQKFQRSPSKQRVGQFHFRVSTKTETLRPWLGKQVKHIKYGKEGENKSCWPRSPPPPKCQWFLPSFCERNALNPGRQRLDIRGNLT